jgi:hypothetical protein
MVTSLYTKAAVRRHKNVQLRLVRAEIERERAHQPDADTATDIDTDRRCVELVAVEHSLMKKLALLGA